MNEKKILGCIFSEKLILEKGKVATYEFTKPIQVLLNTSKVFISLRLIDFKGVRIWQQGGKSAFGEPKINQQ